MDKRYRKYVWMILPVIALALLPVLLRQHRQTQTVAPPTAVLTDPQAIPGIIRIDLPKAPNADMITVLTTNTCDKATGNIYKRFEVTHPGQFDTLYLDLSPKDSRLLFTLYSVKSNAVNSDSPHRTDNETIQDYTLDPSPQPWEKNGIRRYYFKYTTTPGQKVSPDMTKVLPGETGLAWQIGQVQ